MDHGFCCAFNGFIGDHCRSTFEGTEGEDHKSVQRRASEAGWCIGHHEGHVHIVCPECKDLIWDPRPLAPTTPSPSPTQGQ